MSECITIPFLSEFESRLLSGHKTATSRTHKYGNPGDLFSSFGHSFQITKVDKVYLKDVASTYYRQEGFNSPIEFMHCWDRLHPRRNHPDTIVWLHRFKKVS